jgi:kinesin family member 2/24
MQFQVPAMYDGTQKFGYSHLGGFDDPDMSHAENQQMSKSTAFVESNYLQAFPEKARAAPVAKIKVVVSFFSSTIGDKYFLLFS